MDPLPENSIELGMAMRRLRGSRGLREIAGSELCRKVGISKSSLSRYERGLRPPLRHAKLISDLYGGDGWLEVAIHSLWISKWNPWSSDYPQTSHVIVWPASYVGRVWIHVRPNPSAVNHEHTLMICWGPWQVSFRKVIPEEGVFLSTGKGVDSKVSVPCMIESEVPIHVLHGVGSMHAAIDISHDWELR